MPPLLLAVLLLVVAPVCGTLTAQTPTSPAAATAGPSPVRDALTPDTVLRPPTGPTVVLLGTPGRGVSALRLYVPVDEAPGEAGRGRVLADLAERRMAALARPVGAHIRVVRTPRGIAYEAEGATADVEYLAYLLREGAARPDVSEVPFSRARAAAEERVARSRETPAERLAGELRTALDPGTPPPAGTSAGLATLEPSTVLELWQRTHHPERMTVVASAGVIPEVVLAATRGLGTADPTDPGRVYAPSPESGGERSVQTLRSWYGLGWASGAGHAPEGPVTALLLADHLAGLEGSRADTFEASLRLVELPERWGLLLLGAAYPGRVEAMRSALDGALDRLAASLDDAAVARARARVRREILTAARTPMGLVEEVGWRMERSGDAGAARDYLAAVERVGLDSVRAFLDDLRAGGAVSREVRP